MYAKVYFGYLNGQPRASTHASGPTYGQLFSEVVGGREVVYLWPCDMAMSTRTTGETNPLASLWLPVFSGLIDNAFALRGVEAIKRSARTVWVAQRWWCEPTTYADIERELKAAEARKPREVPPASVYG